jgi:hypothetical protein
MISLEAERVFGFQGGENPVAVSGTNGEYLYPSSTGVMVASTEPNVEPKFWVAGDGIHQIGHIAMNPSRTVVAVTERRLKVAIILYSYPQRRQLQRIADVARVDVADMGYSRDGTVFALLADAPQCTVSLFTVDVASGKMTLTSNTTKPHQHLYRTISVDPRNNGQLCASGGGHLVFWLQDAQNKSLVPTDGRVTNAHVRLTHHAWMPNGTVACGTSSGEVFVFSPDDGVGRLAFQLPSLEEQDAPGIASVVVTSHHIILGCTNGTLVFVDHGLQGSQFVVRTTLDHLAAARLLPEWHSLLVMSSHSIGIVHIPGYEDAHRKPEDFAQQAPRVATLHSGCSGEAVGVCHHKGSSATVVSAGGVATTIDYMKNVIVNTVHVGDQPCLVRRFGDHVLAVASRTGTVRMVDVTKPANSAVILRGRICEGPITMCEASKGSTRLFASDGRTIAFFSYQRDEIVMEGIVKVNTPSPAVAISWVDGFGGFLLAQGGGDVGLYSAPFFDDVPENAEGCRELPSEQLFVNSWRLDFPIVALTVTAAFDEVINLLTHSLDKEAKLYLLDRTLSVDRKDREAKALKPQITMKDHEKKGNLFVPLRQKYTISVASDGRLALRDTASYQARIAPTPTSKEKRDPICSVVRHASSKGGIVGVGVSDDETRFVTAGGDGYLIVWTIGKQQALANTPLKVQPSPLNKEEDDDMFYSEKVRENEREVDRLRHEEQRAAVRKTISHLRDRLRHVRKENDAAAEDEKVPLQDFLVEQQKSQFEEQCALAVQEMADTEHYGNLERDYVTGIIKKECWDVMDVQLTKLRAMHADAHVYNFHEKKTSPKDLAILRKLKFLRLVEMRDHAVRNVQSFDGIREPNPAEEDKPPVETVDAPVLTVGTKSIEAEANEDPKPFLYNHLTVFTRHRAIIQLTLLKGRSFAIRSAFNKAFAELVARKKTELIKIDERNVRCRQVLKELDEDRVIFAPGFTKEEDPRSIFDVTDAEVPADKSTDPDEKKRIAVEADERRRWLERHGSDDSADKALKVWMDGRLEKEVRTLDVKIDAPEFADSNSEKFVIPEERSEEQHRIFKEYEKAVQKRMEEVSAKRYALQTEFTQLQKENLELAKKFDAQIVELFQRRLNSQQQCFETELAQVKLSHGVQLHQERSRLAKRMEAHRESVAEAHMRATRSTNAARSKASNAHNKLEQLREDEKNKEKNLRTVYPFSDAEFGDALVRIYTKKKPKKEHGKKKDEKKHDSHAAPVRSIDPFAFIEEERKAKSRRYADDPQYQLPRLDQGEFPQHIWDAFQRYRQDRVNAEREIAMLSDDMIELQKNVEHLEEVESELADRERQAVEEFDAFQRDSLKEQFDVDELHTFRQGQVEVEQAPVVTDYADAVLIFSSEIHRHNKLIRESGSEKIGLLKEINEKRKEIRLIEWEMEYLSFSMGSLEMELRHLHTLRVTKQMQEYINGGGEDHNEKERSKLNRHLDHIRNTMALKIEERRQQILRMKRAVKDKELENMLLLDQVAESKGLVDERASIRDLQSSELDAQRTQKLMKDMRVTRKLEDVAKAQQEEMLLLKKEIDRLRERTFPSFAVVSKRVVGNPDQN